MSDIKLFVTHTPNRDTMRINNPFFYDVIAGSDFQKKDVPEGMLCDNVGENISSKNKSYCELTTQYWVWKNQKADYFGFCHYRRLFSFNHDKLPEDDWGTIVYPAMNDQAMEELHLNEKDIKEYVEQYDFLVAEPISTKQLGAKNVYEHYDNAKELHICDVDILLDIIAEKYPDIYPTAKTYFTDKKFYPCNMFIMKSELFNQYSSFLFDVLEEFENRADMNLYSREGYRTTGHLGERLVGIYYEYLKKKGGYRLGELQIALFKYAEKTDEAIINTTENVVPVVLAANEKYVPILYTFTQSLVNHASDNRQYEIYVFHTDITAESQKVFHKGLEKENVRLQFINVLPRVSGYKLQAKEHITTETFYRFLILDILKDYKKVLYLDCDMIVMRDIAELFDVEMNDTLIGAVRDPDFMGQCNGYEVSTKEYCEKTLKIDPYSYFQAGVLLMNVEELNKITSVPKLLEMADTGIYAYSDQDILNVVCENRVTYLDMSWNMIFDNDHFRWHTVIKSAPYYIMDEYEEARKHPYIIHYAGWLKPWMKPDEDFGEEFWKVARTNQYYETLLFRMAENSASNIAYAVTARRRRGHDAKVRFLQKHKEQVKAMFPKDSAIRKILCDIYWNNI